MTGLRQVYQVNVTLCLTDHVTESPARNPPQGKVLTPLLRLPFIKFGVLSALREQRLVRSALGDLSLLEHDDLVRTLHRIEAVRGDKKAVRPSSSVLSASWISASVRLSTFAAYSHYSLFLS